jgi:hypothetical protein
MRALLESEIAEGSAEERASAAAIVCEELCEHLARVVGRGGVRALFERSVTLAQGEFPWLAGVVQRSEEPLWDRLRDALAREPPDVALEATARLLTTFVERLGRMIGEDLVLRLLREVWSDAVPAAPKKESP